MDASACQQCPTQTLAAQQAETRTAADCGVTKWGTVRAFMKCGACSAGTMNVLNRGFGHPDETAENGTVTLAGGLAQQGYQCGILWGAALAAGAEAHRRYGAGAQAELAAMKASQRLVAAFLEQNKDTNCLELTDTDWTKKLSMLKNFLKGGPITCIARTAKFAPVAFETTEAALAETPAVGPCQPVSCAAELARKLGLPEDQVTTVAGLAGGLGFSGGACGALGAAAWVLSMELCKDSSDYEAANDKVSALIDRFVKSSDYEVECSEIVGRKFEGVEDHAAHVRNGGCAELIEALAQALSEMLAAEQAVPDRDELASAA